MSSAPAANESATVVHNRNVLMVIAPSYQALNKRGDGRMPSPGAKLHAHPSGEH
jgi:hypothetical protein